jgi:adenine-specific DNA-methyltransferase
MDYTIHNGDCLEVMATMDANSVDAIVSDPPYFKVKGEAWDRQWDKPSQFIEWVEQVVEGWYRVLRPNGSVYCFASPKMAARVEVAIAGRFNVLNHVVWAKPPYSTKAEMFDKTTCRSFFPSSERIIFAEHYGADNIAKGEAGYVAKCDELRGFIFEPLRAYLAGEWERAGLEPKEANTATGTQMSGHYFTQSQWALPTRENYAKLQAYANANGGEYLKRDYDDLKRDYDDLKAEYEELRRPFSVTADVPYTDVWSFPTVQHYPGKHPCEKPQALLEHIVTASTREGATVLDTFMGTGSTGLACQKLGRNFIGCELDANYCDTARRRIEHARTEAGLYATA